MQPLKIRQFIEAVLLLSTMALLQFHGWDFWEKHAGPSGPYWSIMIEATALYLWHLGKQAYKFAALASFIVMAAPLHYVTGVLLERYSQNVTAVTGIDDKIAVLDKAITRHTSTIEQYQDNSEARTGWAFYIEDKEKVIAKLESEKMQLIDKRTLAQNTGDTGFMTWLLVVLQGAGFLILMGAQIKIVISWQDGPDEEDEELDTKNVPAITPEHPRSRIAKKTTKKVATRKTLGNKAAQLAKDIVTGKYGTEPVKREINRNTGTHMDTITAAFNYLMNEGWMEQDENGYHLLQNNPQQVRS